MQLVNTWWSACRRCLRVFLALGLGFLLLTSPRQCLANTEEYTMAGANCHRYLRNKEAVVLKGSGGKRYSPEQVCDITVASVNSARWMMHVQTAFILDCRVKVTVYDKGIATASSRPLLEVTCASPDPGLIRLNASLVTVRLYHRNSSDFTFSLVFTATNTNPDHKCPWFLCDSGDCIPKSLMCDGINNCFDNTDEAKNSTAHCDDYWPFKGENWGVLASVLGAAVILIVTAACCRRLKKRRDSFDELYDLNEGPYVHKYAYQYRVIRHPANSNHSNLSNHGHGHGKQVHDQKGKHVT